jgi:signal transduction histidine kinase
MVETVPIINEAGQTVFTYALPILDSTGQRLGIVCLDVQIDSIGEAIVNTAWEQGGYGILLNQDLLVLAHPNEDFVGRNLSDDPVVPISIFADELQRNEEVSEQKVLSYTDDRAVAFFRTTENGWHVGVVIPEDQYYSNVTSMAITLGVLGVVLAVILMSILIRLNQAKDKSDIESRQKSTFLANMSHEIRTPINVVIGMTSIGKTAADVDRKNYCFEKIEESSQHLLGIINDILDMSKIEADNFELSPTEFHFAKMLERVRNITSFRADQKHQRLITTIDEDIPAILVGDDQRLMQVIINLLSNAIKFTPDGGTIRLNAYLHAKSDTGCTILMEIIDTGIGIAPENQVRIFEPFKQADNGTSRKFGGTGLGLYISKRIVEMMGGTIGVTSSPGQGSVFAFSFNVGFCTVQGDSGSVPCAESAETLFSKDVAQEQLPEFGGFTGCHILLAEDIAINREIILAYMEDTGAEIDCAENGIEVLKKFDENPGKYDLVFMDVQMPEMDGLEATRQLRKRGITVPIIAMTANVFKDDIEKCLAAGMNTHLGKPLDMDDVLKTVQTYWKK